MKIVYVLPQFAVPAGTERIMTDKMNYLAEDDNFEVIMLTNEQGAHPLAFPLSSKVKHIDLSVRYVNLYKENWIVRFFKKFCYNRLYRNRFNSFIDIYRPDIVITSTYCDYIMAAIASSPYSFVRVLESHIDRRYIHINDPSKRKTLKTSLMSFFLMRSVSQKAKKFDLLVALNEEDAMDWSKWIKTSVIQDVVHLNPTGIYSDCSSNRVVFVGRYTEQKGVFDLIKIWQIVNRKYPNWRLDLYGNGNLRDVIIEKASSLNINIYVHKPDSFIFDRYIESSVILLTSLYEPFGLVMVEAMSCGVPVVAFDCPFGPNKIITDGVDGFLIKNRDIQLFADKLCELIDSRELRSKMGKAGIKSSQRFSAEVVMPKWKSLFKELIESKK